MVAGVVVEVETGSSSFPSAEALADFFEVSFGVSFAGSLVREGRAIVGGRSARIVSRDGSAGGIGVMIM